MFAIRRRIRSAASPSSIIVAAAALAILWTGPVRAGGPTVIELFTSQTFMVRCRPTPKA